MKRVPVLALVAAFVVTAACSTTPAPQTMASAEPVVASGEVTVRCREILSAGSNAIRRVCGTDEQWARYERRMADASYVFVYRLKGSQY